MTPAVVLRGLERRFGSASVLRGVDLEVAPGERLALLGANGAGKTTLLGVLAGLLRPSRGSVTVLGGSPRDPAVRALVGLVGHTPALYPRLSALENVRFWGGVYRAEDARRRGAVLLADLGLDPDDPRPVSAYSQGMRRRAGLACALLPDPALLLLDEPYAALDRAGMAAVDRILVGGSRTVLVATHEPERAHRFATRALSLRDGRLVDATEVV